MKILGRIDISGGSWTSNDEAVSHYSAMIDQSTLGLRFIKNELRTCSQPAVAWQLDLFGHGREINSLFAQVGKKEFFIDKKYFFFEIFIQLLDGL